MAKHFGDCPPKRNDQIDIDSLMCNESILTQHFDAIVEIWLRQSTEKQMFTVGERSCLELKYTLLSVSHSSCSRCSEVHHHKRGFTLDYMNSPQSNIGI